MPQQRKKEESERLRGERRERDQIKFSVRQGLFSMYLIIMPKSRGVEAELGCHSVPNLRQLLNPVKSTASKH